MKRVIVINIFLSVVSRPLLFNLCSFDVSVQDTFAINYSRARIQFHCIRFFDTSQEPPVVVSCDRHNFVNNVTMPSSEHQA